MSFEDRIKEWVTTDNRIRSHSGELKQLRERRGQLADAITDYVISQNMTNSTVHISDGFLRFHTVKTIPPLTFRFVKQCLEDCISSQEQVDQLIKYIKAKREVRYSPEVKRTYKST
jgi:hypothetical protein